MKFIYFVVIAMLSFGCNREYSINIVIPDGYRGVVHIIPLESSLSGPEYKDAIYEYIIPADGVLRTQDASPFEEWHSLKACFSNGTRLRVPESDSVLSFDDKIGLYSLGVDSDGVRKFFVGTDREYASVREKYWRDL